MSYGVCMGTVTYTYFCPRCGKPTRYNSDRGGLCIDCYTELRGIKLGQKDISVELVVCMGCGKIKYGNTWFEPSRQNFDSILRNIVRKTNLRFFDFKIEMPSDLELSSLSQFDKVYVLTSIFIAGQRTVRRRIEIRINRAFCPICSQKRSGKYYESVLHIRFSREDRSELINILNMFIETNILRADRLEVIDIKKNGAHGIVIRCSSKNLAKKLLAMLHRKFSVIIMNKYREQVTVDIQNKPQRRSIEKYIIRLVKA